MYTDNFRWIKLSQLVTPLTTEGIPVLNRILQTLLYMCSKKMIYRGYDKSLLKTFLRVESSHDYGNCDFTNDWSHVCMQMSHTNRDL